MPFKCLQCDKVAQTISEQFCNCETPNFIKCEVVHLMHPDGPGRRIAKGKKSVGIPTEEPRIEDQYLNICCSNQDKIPIITGIISIITCPECLQFIEQVLQSEPNIPQSEPHDLDKV